MNDIYEERYTRVLGIAHPIHPSTRIGKNVKIGEGVVIDKDCVIGDNCFIGHNTVIRSGVVLGNNTTICHLCMIEADTVIGNRVTIQSQCHITKNATIEDDVFLSLMVGTSNTNRIVHGRNIELVLNGPRIKRAARIGVGAILLPGVIIGENSQVGGGSVVTKDIPDRQVWFGNPAKFIKMVAEEELL